MKDIQKTFGNIGQSGDNTKLLQPISLQNELDAWIRIENIVKAALSLYPTSVEEDMNILERESQHDSLPQSLKNCIVYRRSEKAILDFLQDCAKKVQILSRMNTSEASTMLDQWSEMEGYQSIKQYFDEVLKKLLAISTSSNN